MEIVCPSLLFFFCCGCFCSVADSGGSNFQLQGSPFRILGEWVASRPFHKLKLTCHDAEMLPLMKCKERVTSIRFSFQMVVPLLILPFPSCLISLINSQNIKHATPTTTNIAYSMHLTFQSPLPLQSSSSLKPSTH